MDIKEINAILDSLSTPAEKAYALKILEQFSKNGKSAEYEKLLYEDYKEIPVDIETFLTDYNYLGKAWVDGEGKSKLYPFWKEQLKELFPTNTATAVNNFILSGARGLGKSEIGITAIAYMMYRVMCLKDPLNHFHLKPTERICFAFMNITKTLAEDIGVSKFQNTIQSSPWFLSKGRMTQRGNKPYWEPPAPIKVIIGSQSSHVIGQPIYGAMFDEISFIRNKDVEKQKAIAIDMIDTAIGGMKTRFIHQGQNPTLLMLASSKRSDKSFLEEHMKKKLKSEGSNVIIVDQPVWKVKPVGTYKKETFRVALGNKFLQSQVIPEEDDPKIWIAKGYPKILDVPIDFRPDFMDDIDRALCDYAGVSSSDISKYISGIRWQTIKKSTLTNPFTKDVIEVGNDPRDNTQYYDYFNLGNVDPKMLSKPLFIHLDMSVSGDKTGIGGVWIKGKKPHQEGTPDSKELFYTVAFSVSIKAPKGYQISFEKNRNFIRWLKHLGFNIIGISTDTYQSYDLRQQLSSEGFKCEVVSVDRVKDGICIPYQYFKNTIYEERMEIYDKCDLLTNEVLGLEKNASGVINHPDEGRSGSKDQADAVCGATYLASQFAEQYAYDYGESMEFLKEMNSDGTEEAKQLTLSFEEELKKMNNAMAHHKNPNIDEGTDDYDLYGDNIVVLW